MEILIPANIWNLWLFGVKYGKRFANPSKALCGRG
jgi:hypothetical protein